MTHAAQEAQDKANELQAEMAKKQADWDAERLKLEETCVSVYEDVFLKAMKQATTFAPDLDPTVFDIDKEEETLEDQSPKYAPVA